MKLGNKGKFNIDIHVLRNSSTIYLKSTWFQDMKHISWLAVLTNSTTTNPDYLKKIVIAKKIK